MISCNVSMPYYITTVYLLLTAPADSSYPFFVLSVIFKTPSGSYLPRVLKMIIIIHRTSNYNTNHYKGNEVTTTTDCIITVSYTHLTLPTNREV